VIVAPCHGLGSVFNAVAAKEVRVEVLDGRHGYPEPISRLLVA
jgi:hypothetical protein